MYKECLDEAALKRVLQLIKTELDKYVKSVDGKGLSTEDFTTELKKKLDEIDPSKYVENVDGKGLSTEDFTTLLKTKLENIDLSEYVTNKELTGAVKGKADSAATLAGYGITDAYTKNEVDDKLGDLDSALDIIIAEQESIIAIQNELIGGESV